MESWQLAKRQLAKGYNYPNSPNLRLPDSSKNVNYFSLAPIKNIILISYLIPRLTGHLF
jgi:hypothetical protein